MNILSPAKINLHLRVGPPGADGFHPLLTWMCTAGLCDELTFAIAPKIELRCDRPDLPVDESNLIVRAAHALAAAEGTPVNGASIMLKKRIPMGGGLGGGSSNAAWTLLALNRLWNLDWPIDRLAEIAARLGSDVPFFLLGPSSICTSRGERVDSIPPPRPRFAVLIFPAILMPTPHVYRKFDEMKLGSREVTSGPPTDFESWTTLKAADLLPRLVNDLEPPAFAICPELGQLRSAIEQKWGRVVRMSGSGSTLFTLTDEEDGARHLARQIDFKQTIVWIASLAAPSQ